MVASHFLSTIVDTITNKNHLNTWPVLTGAHHKSAAHRCSETAAELERFLQLQTSPRSNSNNLGFLSVLLGGGIGRLVLLQRRN
jgi:hypothetical protein